MGRRAKGEGSLYKTIQKQKRPKFATKGECAICRECKDRTACNNRQGYEKCEKCKNCKEECLKYCDRFYCKEIWQGQATINGKHTTLSTHSIQSKAKDKKEKVKNQKENGTFISKSSVTLYDLCSEIVEDRYKRNKTGKNGYRTNKATLKRLNKSSFVHIPIQKITDEDINQYLDDLVEESHSLIKKDYGLINCAFNKATPNIILKNPFEREEFSKPRSKKPKKKVKAFTVKEQQKFIHTLKDMKVQHRYKWAWLLSLYTGMRIGEVLALDKDKDIDWESYKIDVNNTLTKDENDKVYLGDRTKTYTGMRTLNMDAMVIYILKQAINEYIPNSNNVLFCRENGDLINEGASNSAFKRFCQKYEITNYKDVNQHMLRHSFATRKIEGGMPAEVLMVILGHKDVETTLNTYFDAFAEYRNVYEEKTYNYYELQGLTFDIVNPEFIILQELNNMLEKANCSHLENIDKQQIIQLITNIINRYNKKDDKQEELEENIGSNIIMFPAMCK